MGWCGTYPSLQRRFGVARARRWRRGRGARCGRQSSRAPRREMTRLLFSLALGVMLSACVAAHGRAEALYPFEGARPAPESVARVEGYILEIDDKRVNEGKVYEVLPGCHAIRTPERWGRGDSTGAVSVRTGQRGFSIDAKPGYTYDVEIT